MCVFAATVSDFACALRVVAGLGICARHSFALFLQGRIRLIALGRCHDYTRFSKRPVVRQARKAMNPITQDASA